MSLLNSLGDEFSYSSRSGLPLYAYDYDPASISQLTDELRLRLRRRAQDFVTAEAFVLWAVERIRSAYQGGPLTWKLVFDGLGLPEDRDLACDLVVTGLGRFKRRVRRSDNGRTLYLFTLLAEGGVPDPMLRQGNGVYRRVVLGILNEIEREGGVALDPGIAEQIAGRRAAYLPDVFHHSEAARTLADLALALAALRQALPDGVPGSAAVAWFDANRPDWRRGLPLRLSAAALEALVIPALEMVRISGPGGETVSSRELRLGVNGEWVSFLRISLRGWLEGATLPNARGLNLRLIGSGLPSGSAFVFYGAWEDSGWTLSRPGGSDLVIPLTLDTPFSLKAYADGVAVGESIVDPGLPLANEAPSFWRAVDGQGIETCGRLAPQQGRPKSRAPWLWLLAAADAQVGAGPGVTIGEGRGGPEGKVLPVCGAGRVRVGEENFEVATGAEVSERAHAIEAIGPSFTGWQLPSGGSVFLGRPTLRATFPGAGDSRVLRDSEIKRDPGLGLGAEFVSWMEQGEPLARIKTICLPDRARIEARETRRGGLELSACGLEHGWRLALRVGKDVAHAALSTGVAEIEMPAPKAPPAMISVRLSDPRSGKTLDLVAPWPARQGMLLSPRGERLQRDEPICVEELMGWRAVAPGANAKLLLRAHGGGEVSIAGGDEYPLTLLAPQIRSMLALGGPDAQVNLSLVVNGSESRRLQVRRYHDATQLDGDWLHVALSRDGPDSGSRGRGRLFDGQVDVHIDAIEIENGSGQEKELVTRNLNLRELLGGDSGLWIVLGRVRGRVQRAVAWSPRPLPRSRRADRIASYAEEWKRLTRETDADAWKEQWSTIGKVQRRADVGCLDRVQALASAPRALVKQAYLVGTDRLADHLTLDHAAPFLWPAIPLAEFTEGLRGAIEHMTALLATLAGGVRVREMVSSQLVLRSHAIVALRPDLAAHIGHALNALGLIDHLPPSEFLAVLSRFATPRPLPTLQQLAQSAAQKPVETPVGIVDLRPQSRPPRMEFAADRQRLVDAPLVVAEAATERRPALIASEVLALVLLRMCDSEFFDRAVAAAIQLAIEERG